MKKFVYDFFRENNFLWDMFSAICFDRAPAMLGQNSGFDALMKVAALLIIVTHCVLHIHVLAIKTLPLKLAEVLKIVVEYVNCVKLCSEAPHLQRSV